MAASGNLGWTAQWTSTPPLVDQLQQNCNSSGGEWDSSDKICHCDSGTHWDFNTNQCASEVWITFGPNVTNNEANCKSVFYDICTNVLGAQNQEATGCRDTLYNNAVGLAQSSGTQLTGGSTVSGRFGATYSELTSNGGYLSQLENMCGMEFKEFQNGTIDWTMNYQGL